MQLKLCNLAKLNGLGEVDVANSKTTFLPRILYSTVVVLFVCCTIRPFSTSLKIDQGPAVLIPASLV